MKTVSSSEEFTGVEVSKYLHRVFKSKNLCFEYLFEWVCKVLEKLRGASS
jgi:hypothetical protein